MVLINFITLLSNKGLSINRIRTISIRVQIIKIAITLTTACMYIHQQTQPHQLQMLFPIHVVNPYIKKWYQ